MHRVVDAWLPEIVHYGRTIGVMSARREVLNSAEAACLEGALYPQTAGRPVLCGARPAQSIPKGVQAEHLLQ
jgi:hypothetical protein